MLKCPYCKEGTLVQRRFSGEFLDCLSCKACWRLVMVKVGVMPVAFLERVVERWERYG